MIINKVEAYATRLLLKEPYSLSFGDIEFFHSVITIIRANDQEVYGESECLPVYYWEGDTDPWVFAKMHGGELIGKTPETAHELVSKFKAAQPCCSTALLTALEQLFASDLQNPPEAREVPMVAMLGAKHKEQIETSIPKILEQGYKDIKVKVGFNVEEDLSRMRVIQPLVGEKAKIRVDANQAYKFSEAEKFVKNVDPQNIELLEQPFKPEEWEAMEQLAKISPVPLMLDESIYTEKDVEQTYQLKCAKFVKFKLMKIGSASLLVKLIRKAQENGLEVILGNGACGDVGNYHEAIIASSTLNTAGEMNGFLKLKESILIDPLPVEGSKIILKPDYSLQIDREKLKKYAHDYLKWEL